MGKWVKMHTTLGPSFWATFSICREDHFLPSIWMRHYEVYSTDSTRSVSFRPHSSNSVSRVLGLHWVLLPDTSFPLIFLAEKNVHTTQVILLSPRDCTNSSWVLPVCDTVVIKWMFTDYVDRRAAGKLSSKWRCPVPGFWANQVQDVFPHLSRDLWSAILPFMTASLLMEQDPQPPPPPYSHLLPQRQTLGTFLVCSWKKLNKLNKEDLF